MWFWAGVALAGDLYVSSAVPVNVWVDGTWVPYQHGTTTAYVGGLVGIHRVQVAGGDNVVVGETSVQIPRDGVRTVTWDGASMVVGAPAQPQPQPQVILVPTPLPAPAPAPAPVPTGPVAMSASAFASLVAAVDSGSFADDKLASIRSAASGNWFTVEQVGRLVDGLTYGSDQVEAVRICAPKVVDPQNAFSLSSHFTYGSDKEAALALFR